MQVVVMIAAEYGRMRIGRCVEDGLGFLGCSSNVLSLADRKCSGRQSCRISIPDKDFDSTRPCNKEVKVYLEASYVCKRGMHVPRIYTGCSEKRDQQYVAYNFDTFKRVVVFSCK